jgi:uncharacterized protein (TIGR02453 family)
MVRVINPLDDIVPPVFGGFPDNSLKFLRKLKKNNNREWFNEHKPEYVADIKEPMESLLAALEIRMKEIMPEIEIDPKKSIYRIYRDIRFSKDKTPYKTHAGAAFTVSGRDRKYDPGYYFHISPEEIIVAGGAYSPPSEQLKAIRNALAEEYKDFRKIIKKKDFVEHFEQLDGDSLTRLPRGFDAGHPVEELLKKKAFYCWASMEPKIALDEEFIDILVNYFKSMTPLVKWLLEKSN